MEPEFTIKDIPRYSEKRLPKYRHLPFRNLHPFLDRGGHSYGEKLTSPESFSPENWADSKDYRYCIDLFNHGFWWEAHERLKYLSMAAGRETETGQFIQGLIQVAAALLKHFMDEEGGAQTLAQLGIENLNKKEGTYLGIEVKTLIQQVEECLESKDGRYPRIILT